MVWLLEPIHALTADGPTPVPTDKDKAKPTTKAVEPPHVMLKDIKLTSVTFSRDGKSLYTAGWDDNVTVWDLTKNKRRGLLNGDKQ